MEIFSVLLDFCAGIHRSPVNLPHKGQWHGALMLSFICAWPNGWDTGVIRRHRAHCDVIVMSNANQIFMRKIWRPLLYPLIYWGWLWSLERWAAAWQMAWIWHWLGLCHQATKREYQWRPGGPSWPSRDLINSGSNIESENSIQWKALSGNVSTMRCKTGNMSCPVRLMMSMT